MSAHFADFYQRGTTGKIVPACGSDAHLCIDGRFGLDRATDCALQHMESLSKIGKNYCGFALFRVAGRRTGNEHPYYTWGSCS
jgi:hypothetical protein